MRQSKHFARFDPDEVQALVDRAKAGDLAAKSQLVLQYKRLVSSIVTMLQTGKVNPYSSRTKKFLRLFSKEKTDYQNVAMKLKQLLATCSNEELWVVGTEACYLAIERTVTNYSSTIVYCFAELIHEMLEEIGSPFYEDTFLPSLEAHISHDLPGSSFVDNIYLEEWMDTLSETDYEIVEAITKGESKVKIPKELKEEIRNYLGI